MPEPTQPNTNPNPADPTPPATGTPPASNTNEPKTPPSSGEPDLSKLTEDQLQKVLENPALWNLPRIKELRDAQANLKKIQDDQAKANDQKLKDDKKWEELSTQKEQENTTLRENLKSLQINQAVTNELVKLNVVDLDGALKLLDRNKLTVGEDGQVTGTEDAINALKTDKPYLFKEGGGQPTVGTPSNPTAPTGSGQYRFKESQLTPAFYQEHQKEIDEAGRLGLIEPDGPPR